MAQHDFFRGTLVFDRPTAIRNRLQAPLLLAGAVLLLWFAFE